MEEQQCDVECRNKNGITSLHHAAGEGRFDIVQYLISERGCDPMCSGQWGRTPLHSACNKGQINEVKYLVEDVKVEPSYRDEHDATPLHMASVCGQLSVVRLLVEDYLCDPTVRDKNGETSADYAQTQGHTHITSYLSSIEKIVSSELVLAVLIIWADFSSLLLFICTCMMTSKGLLVVYRPYTINTGSTAGVWVVIL